MQSDPTASLDDLLHKYRLLSLRALQDVLKGQHALNIRSVECYLLCHLYSHEQPVSNMNILSNRVLIASI